MENIVTIILHVIVLLFIAYILPIVRGFFAEKLGEEKAKKLEELITDLVLAAEQIFKEVPKSGKEKKEYVVKGLENAGYAVTQEINAKIESAVYSMTQLKEGAKWQEFLQE